MSEIDDFLKPKPKGKPGAIDSFLGTEPPNDPGFVSTIKNTGGHMLTTGATSIEGLVGGPNAVTEKVRSIGQGIIDRNPSGINSLADVVESPWLAVREATGQIVPQVGAAMAGAAGGAAIGRRVAGAPGAAIGGGIGSLVPILSQEYGGIYDDQPEGQKDKGRALIAALGATALERLALPVGIGGGLKALKAGTSIPGAIAKGVLKEGGTEAAQTAIEQVGAFKDPTTSESMQEQALAGVMGGIGGGVIGGVHAGAEKALGGTKKPSGETEQPAGETGQAPGVTQPGQGETPATTPTPQAIRAQKLPETGPLTGAVNAGIEATARAAEPPMSEDDMAAALFHVESKRQDGTPQGARFAAEFDAGRISPREALEAFRLERSPEFTLPQPGVAASELPLEEAAALAAQGDLEQPIPVGQATDLPVDVVEPAPPMPDDPRAARTPRVDPAAIDPAAPNAVAQYIERLRAINTPAAQAFVRDFEAGRISPQVVLDAMLPRPQESADQRLQAAAAHAPAPAPDAGIVIPERPRTLRDAQAKRAAEKATQQQQETASAPSPAQQPAAPGPAIVQQPAPGPLTAAAQTAAAPAQPPQVAGEPAGGAVGPAGGSATPEAPSVAQPEQPGSATPAAPPAPGEKWHYRSAAGLREMPADRMKDAREVSLVPGLRFLAHRDLGEGKTWSVTERTTGNTLTTGHTTRELAEFAAQQRVQQVGADKVRSVVREFLQKTGGLTEGEALAGTAEPRKGKVPGLDEVIAAYKRATGGELDANMNATAAHFHRALADQNVKTIRDLSHPDNPASRRVIETLGLGGRKLPRSAKESAKIAEDWLRSLHQQPTATAPAPNAAAPVSTQAPAPAAGATVAAAPATPRRGEIGMQLGAGEIVLTSSGRKTTPFPKVSLGSNGQAAKTVAAADRWLLDNAAAEARARGDEFNAPTFEADAKLKSIPQASKDAAEEYLFGTQPAVPRPFLKPLAPAAAAPATPIDPVKRRAVLQALRDCLAA